MGVEEVCFSLFSIDDAQALSDAIQAYLDYYMHDPISFADALGLDIDALIETGGSELAEQTVALAAQAAWGLSGEAARWIGVFAVGVLLPDSQGNHNAHVELAYFHDGLKDMINAWETSGRDDLTMNFSLTHNGGYFNQSSFLFTLEGPTITEDSFGRPIFHRDYVKSFDYYSSTADYWGNDFGNLLVSLLVDTHDEIGFGFTHQTWWSRYTYESNTDEPISDLYWLD